MPKKKHKAHYPVLALTVTLISLGGIALKSATGLLPQNPENRLGLERAAYLRQASRHRIDWYPWGEEAFKVAKERKKPILLVIGAAWSSIGRRLDSETFADTDVQSLLAVSAVCVRADLAENPELVSAFVPLSRATEGWDPSVQIVVLNSQGQLVTDIPINFGPAGTRSNDLFVRFREAFDQVAKASKPGSNASTGSEQLAQFQLLSSPQTEFWPRFDLFEAAIQRRADTRTGLFPARGASLVYPNVYRYLLITGRRTDFDALMSPMLSGPLVDWLDGGFFRATLVGAPHWIDFDKLATQNAELAQALAQADAMEPSPLYRRVAERAFDSLIDEFCSLDDMPAMARIGDEGPRQRSNRTSFSVRELVAGFSEDERAWMAENMGLRQQLHPMMTVTLPDPAVALKQQEKFEAMLDKLRATKTKRPRMDGRQRAATCGVVVARLIQTASTLGDEPRLAKALSLWNLLKRFNAGQDVIHRLDELKSSPPILADYLAIADASLQHYIVSGDELSFRRGLMLLERATSLFGGTNDEVWYPTYKELPEGFPPHVRMPELCDFLGESSTAAMIRLSGSYGKLLRGAAKADRASHLNQIAASTVTANAAASAQLGLYGAGYFNAALGVANDTHAVVVGPNDVRWTQTLRQKVPGRIAAPARGPVRPDLQARAPGVYVIHGDSVFGPFGLDEGVQTFRREASQTPIGVPQP